jgi:AraC-like DNA-binding protein
MFRLHETPRDGDPSRRIQKFEEIHPRLLCCRYWWLTEWKSRQMSFPYWRFYWNRTPGAVIVYKKAIELGPGRIILIPPNTPFSTRISGNEDDGRLPYSLKGGWVDGPEMEQEMIRRGNILHLFIHFTLGHRFDRVIPDIFAFDINEFQESLIRDLVQKLMARNMGYDQAASMEIYALIFNVINQLPDEIWKQRDLDVRVTGGIRFMEKHMHDSIQNSSLAKLGHMSMNAYSRLFRQETGTSPRKYLLRLRIEKACSLLHHSDMSIEQIASSCGFSDRYYFTRIFTRTMRVPPGLYRRNTLLKN